MKTLLWTTALVSATLLSTAASAAVLTGPSTTSALVGGSAGGVRFRSFDLIPPPQGSGEVYVGRNLGSGGAANRAEGNGTWSTANNFTISYDAGTDRLSATVLGSTTTYGSDFLGSQTGPIALKGLNRLSISLRDADQVAPNSSVGLTNLVLNGNALSPSAINASEDNIERFFAVGGDFRQSFTLTGTLNLSGDFSPGGQEGSRVEFLIGNNGVPEPASWAMMIGGFGFAGAAMRRRNVAKAVLA